MFHSIIVCCSYLCSHLVMYLCIVSPCPVTVYRWHFISFWLKLPVSIHNPIIHKVYNWVFAGAALDERFSLNDDSSYDFASLDRMIGIGRGKDIIAKNGMKWVLKLKSVIDILTQDKCRGMGCLIFVSLRNVSKHNPTNYAEAEPNREYIMRMIWRSLLWLWLE